MPARTTRSDRRIPRSFPRFGRLPQREVARAVFVVFIDVDAGAIQHAAEISFRELAVLGKFGDAEVIRPVVGAVGEAFFHQLRYEVRHFRNVFRGTHQRWLLNANHGRIFEKRLLVLRGILLHADSLARRIANNLVVHIGNVHDVAHFVSALPQESPQNIDGNEGTEVANVSVVVDRRPAGVHADFVVAKRAEFLNLRGHSVKKTKRHKRFKHRKTN